MIAYEGGILRNRNIELVSIKSLQLQIETQTKKIFQNHILQYFLAHENIHLLGLQSSQAQPQAQKMNLAVSYTT